MNRKQVISILIIAVSFFSNCNASRTLADSGEAVESVSTFWKQKNNVDSPLWIISEKAWYQDSVGITQVCGIFTSQIDTIVTTTIQTIGYRFVDLRKKCVYEYGSFSDTSSIKRKYRYSDTTVFAGGWNFATRTPTKFDSSYQLTDTIVNSITYKRRKLFFEFNHTRFESIGMFRCDNKITQFAIDTGISNKTGCPLVFFSMNPISKPNARLDQEVKYISNSFPDSVTKIFAAWKMNEKKFPVE